MGISDMLKMGSFQHATGCLPDTKELEYLSALLQTSSKIRTDGTISSTDIQNYLTSRYGIFVSQQDAIDIINGLGGGTSAIPASSASATVPHNTNPTTTSNDPNNTSFGNETTSCMDTVIKDNTESRRQQQQKKSQQSQQSDPLIKLDDTYLDLVQLTSILLIPSFLKAKREVDLWYGIIPQDLTIPDDPDLSYKLMICNPCQYHRNIKLRKDLLLQRKQRKHKNSLRVTPRRIIYDVFNIIKNELHKNSNNVLHSDGKDEMMNDKEIQTDGNNEVVNTRSQIKYDHHGYLVDGEGQNEETAKVHLRPSSSSMLSSKKSTSNISSNNSSSKRRVKKATMMVGGDDNNNNENAVLNHSSSSKATSNGGTTSSNTSNNMMIINKEFIQNLLSTFKFDDELQNSELIDEMLALALSAGGGGDDDGGGGVEFTEQVFAHCLTSDINLYETGIEDNDQTTYSNIFSYRHHNYNTKNLTTALPQKQKHSYHNKKRKGDIEMANDYGGGDDHNDVEEEEDLFGPKYTSSLKKEADDMQKKQQKQQKQNVTTPTTIGEGDNDHQWVSFDDDDDSEDDENENENNRRNIKINWSKSENANNNNNTTTNPLNSPSSVNKVRNNPKSSPIDVDDSGILLYDSFDIHNDMEEGYELSLFPTESNSLLERQQQETTTKNNVANDNGNGSSSSSRRRSDIHRREEQELILPPNGTINEVYNDHSYDDDGYNNNAVHNNHHYHRPDTIPSAPYIDYSSDQHKSILYHMFLWGYFIFAAGALLALLNINGLTFFTCSNDSVWCIFSQQVWTWFVYGAILSASGYVVIVPMSLANSPQAKMKDVMISLSAVLLFNFVPFIILWDYRTGIPHSPDGVLSPTEQVITTTAFTSGLFVYILFGCCVFIEILRTAPSLLDKDRWPKTRNFFAFYLPSSSEKEILVKRAATKKVNDLLKNARDLHLSQSYRGDKRHILERFILYGRKTEECGGLLWTLKQFRCNKLLKQYGIWLPSNLAVGQEGQIIALIFLFIVGLVGMFASTEAAEERRTELEQEPESIARDTALYYIPEPWVIFYSFIVGAGVAGIIGCGLVLVYTPSTVSTVMKLRTGQIKTLTNPKFEEYRGSADSLCYNPGNMIYALIGSVGIYFLISGAITFLFCWAPSRDFMILLVGWGLGLGLTIGLKSVIIGSTRSTFQATFYRKLPKRANMVMVGLQSWNIGLGTGAMLGRIIQFLLAAAFWVGRIDAKFLDDEVQLFGYSFDYLPFNYRKDILVHEAHRHPWIDRLGGMCSMRLKYGSRFGTDAGACWRRIFVIALLPWLQKYRISTSNQSEEAIVQRLMYGEYTLDAVKRQKDRLVGIMNLKGDLKGLHSFMGSGKKRKEPSTSGEIAQDLVSI